VGLFPINFPPLSSEEKPEHPSWQGAALFTLTPGSHSCIRGFSADGQESSKQSPRINETKDILKVNGAFRCSLYPLSLSLKTKKALLVSASYL
jgi:hypothetical protein